jgi:CBS domain-containing protein
LDDVKNLIRTRIPSVGPDDRVARVALVLCRTHSNSAVVRDGKKFAGYVMRKQLLRPPVAPDTKAERLLTHPPVLSPSSKLDDSISLMLQSGCDMLPVIARKNFEGVVLARDLAANHPSLGRMDLEEVTHGVAPGIPAASTISDAATALRNYDMESIPLVEKNDELGGWATFADIQRFLIAPEKGVRGTGEFIGEKEHPLRNPVLPLASHTGSKVATGSDVGSALKLMGDNKGNEVTVVDGNMVVIHIGVLGILSLTRQPTEMLVQVAGLEDADPIDAGQLVDNLRATAAKLQRICRGMGTPELKVKTYEHRGSSRKRYEVRVAFSVPDQYVAEAKGWNLLRVGTQAIKKVEREIIMARSKTLEAHRHRRTRPAEGVD